MEENWLFSTPTLFNLEIPGLHQNKDAIEIGVANDEEEMKNVRNTSLWS